MSLVATFDVETVGGGGGDRRLRHSIYLGGKTDAKDYDKLVHRWKITHVLNCTPPKQTNIEAGVPNYFEKRNPKAAPQHRRLAYRRIPIYDSPTSLSELSSVHEATIIGFITTGLCHGNVFVHCSRGVSRSTTSVILYLMAKRQFRYETALALIRRRRPEAQPIPAFEGWLQTRDVFYHKAAVLKQQNEQNSTSKCKSKSKTPETTTTTTTTRASASHAERSPKKRKLQNQVGAPAIGPAPPPPSVIIGEPSVIGPPIPCSGIGPDLPPVAKPATFSTVGPHEPSTKTKTKTKTDDPSIGPELPPVAALAAAPTENNSRTDCPPRTSIGPALPP